MMLKNRYVGLLLVFLIFIFWNFLLPGPRAANDFPYAYQDSVKEGFNLPQAWSSRGNGLGEYSVSTLWAWPADFLYGLGAKLGIEFSILERVLGILPFLLLGTFSIWKFLGYFKLDNRAKLVGSLFYLSNTYAILLIDGGQLSIALAYIWLPTVFLLVDRAVLENNGKLLASIGIAILGIFDIRFIYVAAILFLLRFCYQLIFAGRGERVRWALKWLTLAAVISIVFILINFYWILPAVVVKKDLLPTTYSQVNQTSFLNFTDIKHSISLLQPHWYENVFGKIPPFRKEFLIIPFLAFIAIFLMRKNREVWFWAIVGAISVFLAKGANPPFSNVYPWIFTHVPGFSLFRDSTKFFFLVSISYSVLIAFTVSSITKKFPKIKAILPALLVLYLIFLVRPVYLVKMTGLISTPIYQNEFEELNNIIGSDKTWGRILTIPTRAPLGYASEVHTTLEGLRLAGLRPFAVSAVGKYEIFNFLRESPIIGELLDILGVRYIVYPYPDTRREELKQDNIDYYHAFSDQLEHQLWTEKKISDFPVNAFKTKSNQERFFLTDHTLNVVGSDSIYTDLIKINGFTLGNNAVIFAEEEPETLKDLSSTKVILFDKNMIDLIASMVSKNNFIFPAESLPREPVLSVDRAGIASRSLGVGWWMRGTGDLVWWRDFLQKKYNIDNQDFDYGGGYSIAEGDRELTINNKQLLKGNKLLARVMTSSWSGKVEFWQGDEKIGEVNTLNHDPGSIQVKLTGYKEIPDQIFEYDKADFKWFEIGDLVENETVTIKTSGDINVVNSLISVSAGEWDNLKHKAEDLKQNGNIIAWHELTESEKIKLFESHNDSTVSYSRISPTHYKVKVTNLDSPATLIFSETFDPNWVLNNQNSSKIYSLINGFKVHTDGEYDIYYFPQKYILIGFMISLATFAAFGGYFLYTLISEKKNQSRSGYSHN